MSKETLLALAARCEKADGRVYRLDYEIAVVIGIDMDGPNRIAHFYTASIDAALTLVPEGWEWTVECGGHVEMVRDRMRGPSVEGNATTPALALVSAALKARAQSEQNHD